MGNRRRGYTLKSPVLPQDEEGIAARLDPRFCAACPPGETRLEKTGATFCPECREARLRVTKRLWARQEHRVAAKKRARSVLFGGG